MALPEAEPSIRAANLAFVPSCDSIESQSGQSQAIAWIKLYGMDRGRNKR
jgi:hypothetical protein